MHAELKSWNTSLQIFHLCKSFIALCSTGGGGSLSISLTHTLALFARFLSNSFSPLLPPSLHHHYHFASLLLKHTSISKPISLVLWQLLQVSIRCDRFGPSTPRCPISSSSLAPSWLTIISLAAWVSAAKRSKQFPPTSPWRLLTRLSVSVCLSSRWEGYCPSGEGGVYNRF